MKLLGAIVSALVVTANALTKQLESIPGSGVTKEGRAEDFRRIKKYELIDVRYAEETGFLEFQAFGETYKVLLERNENLVASEIKHAGAGIPTESSGYITSLTESCHYQVKDVSESNTKLYGIGGGLSMCNKRGLRGHFWHEDESWYIKPAKYFLGDIYNTNSKYHDISEKHLIYKESDYDSSGFEWAKHLDATDSRVHGRDRNSRADVSQADFDRVDSRRSKSRSHNRKLTQTYNGGNNYVEMGIVADKRHYENYYSAHGNDWYDELFAWVLDSFNTMNGIYVGTDFGNSIGGFSIIFREYEVFTSFSGNYAMLEPEAGSSDCTDWQSGACGVSTGYLGLFRSYVSSYKDTNSLDNYMFLTGYNMVGAAGVAYLGVVCTAPSWSVSINAFCCGDAWWQKTIAHEFGMHSYFFTLRCVFVIVFVVFSSLLSAFLVSSFVFVFWFYACVKKKTNKNLKIKIKHKKIKKK